MDKELKNNDDGREFAAVMQRVETLLRKGKFVENVKEEIRQIARGQADDVINLNGKEVGPAGARALAEALKNSPNTRQLLLASNNLGAEGAHAIAGGMKHVPNLRELILCNNALSPEGAQAIAGGLRLVPKLQELNLGGNDPGMEGARAIADGLTHVPNLQWLSLLKTSLGLDGVKAVADAVKRHRGLRFLELGGERLQREQFREASNAHQRLSRLTTLHLFVTSSHPEAAHVLGSALPRDREVKASFKHKQDSDAFEAARPASSSPLMVAQLKQPLRCTRDHFAAKEKQLKDARDLVQQLLDSNACFLVEAAAKDATIQQQAKQLKRKDNLIQQLEARIEELGQQLKMKHDTELHAEATINLNIPPTRFGDKTEATDNNGEPVAGAFSSLHTATLAGHRVAMKDIRPVKHRPRLSQLLECRHNNSSTTGSGNSTPSTATTNTTTAHDQRLHREALILLSIRHPNIVSFLGLSHDDDNSTLSFVLSWAEGGSLYDHLHVHKRELTKTQRERIAMEVAGAMQFLQAHGVVHRDLKSPNVLLDGSLSAKVTDFGLSAFKRGDDKTLTHQKGTPLWASPEQLLELKLYADTDVFSFGVLYWELCFNCKPWHHGKHKGKGASQHTISKYYEAHRYLPVDQAINDIVLSAAEQQLLDGCFDVSGNRLDFTQLHTALWELYNAALHHQKLGEEQQTEMLFGAKDAVWKFPPPLLEAVKAVTKQLPSRPSVSIAPLDLKRDVDAVKKLLTEAGGPTADQSNPLKPFGKKLAAVAITRDKQKEVAFNGALARNRTRYRGHLTSGSSHPFSPKYKHSTSTKEPTNEEHKQVLRRVTRGTAYKLLDCSLFKKDPPLRLQRVFHGVTSWKAVVGILGGDFASLQQVDSGFYGTGVYFTPDLDYALKYSHAFWDHSSATVTVPSELQHLGLDASKEYRVVLACDVQYGNPYPVLNAVQFKGKPLMPAHDAHVAVVKAPKKAKLNDAVPFQSHTKWTNEDGRRPFAEIVVDDPSCVLVRAMLVFEA